MVGFRERNFAILSEGQAALNVAFGAILSAYIGNTLTDIDNHPFNHVALAKFFLFVAVFILGLCVGNAVILRGEFRLGVGLLGMALIGAIVANQTGRTLGFEVIVLRLLAATWFVALLGSNAVLTMINYLHYRTKK